MDMNCYLEYFLELVNLDLSLKIYNTAPILILDYQTEFLFPNP